MSIAWVVHHLADAETHWFVRSFLGQVRGPRPGTGEPLPVLLDAYDAPNMINETARHLGHLDILRELTDGVRGLQ